MRKILRSQKGFTLIELLVVIAILGAIAGVVVLNVGGFIGRGKCEGYCTEKHNVTTACMAALTENGTSSAWGNYVLGGAGAAKYTWSVNADCSQITAEDAPDQCSCD